MYESLIWKWLQLSLILSRFELISTYKQIFPNPKFENHYEKYIILIKMYRYCQNNVRCKSIIIMAQNIYKK